MAKKDKKIDPMEEFLDEVIAPTQAELEDIDIKSDDIHSSGTKIDIAEDYNFVREKLIKSIVRGSELIDTATVAAKTVPTARQIEAAGAVVKQLTEASKSLIDLHEKMRSIEKVKGPAGTNTNGDEDENDLMTVKATLTEIIDQIKKEDEEKEKATNKE